MELEIKEAEFPLLVVLVSKIFPNLFAPFFWEDSKPFLLTSMFSKGGSELNQIQWVLAISSRTPFRKFTNHRKLTS